MAGKKSSRPYESPEEWTNDREELEEAPRRGRRPHGPPKPVVVDIECASPREWRWFKNMAIEQGWARATSGEYSLELTDLPENLPERFHQAVQAAGCKIKVVSRMEENVSKPRKEIAELIEELRSWLPNYDHGPDSFPNTFYRIIASLPGGEELEDMGYEPMPGIGWHEADLLGRVLVAIEGKYDVEDLVQGLVHDENEEVEEEIEEEDLEEASRRNPGGLSWKRESVPGPGYSSYAASGKSGAKYVAQKLPGRSRGRGQKKIPEFRLTWFEPNGYRHIDNNFKSLTEVKKEAERIEKNILAGHQTQERRAPARRR